MSTTAGSEQSQQSILPGLTVTRPERKSSQVSRGFSILIIMNRAVLGLIGLVWACGSIGGQESREQQTIVNLQTPIYPPMALAARVSGEVNLDITLTADGAAGTVAVQGGPPMLRQAALDGATRSRFRAETGDACKHISVTYRFVLDSPTSCERDNSYPRLKFDGDLVTVTEQAALLCDPASAIERVRFRSVKCLYLWKCGSKTP
jgi:TonB family protein